MLNPTSQIVETKPGGTDVAIRYRDRRRPRDDVEPILVTDMIALGAPSLPGDRDYPDPASLAGFPSMQELGPNEAADLFTRHGVIA